jgi:type IV secretory pathway VirB2 component (pilin)
MSKTVTLDWKQFINGNIIPKEKPDIKLLTGAASYIPAVMMTQATNDSTWTELLGTVLDIANWLCVGVIIFAGVTWMFGNRTKALELLMGACAGTLIIIHAVDIKDWLNTL